MVSLIKTDSGVLTGYLDGKAFSVAVDHPAYSAIEKALKSDDPSAALKLLNSGEVIVNYFRKSDTDVEPIRISNNKVFYRGEEIHHEVTNRIVDFLRYGLPVDPMVAFIEDLLQNTSRHSIYQLDNFLNHRNLPLTDDGCFIAFKRVQDNWTDFWTGTIDNSIGNIVEMPRNQVEDDWTKDCAPGLHAGSVDYVEGYHSGKGHIVLVKIQPQHVVSVPQGYTTKLRCCRYQVIKEIDQSLKYLPKPLYNVNNISILPANNIELQEVKTTVQSVIEPIPSILQLWCENNFYSVEKMTALYQHADPAVVELLLSNPEQNLNKFLSSLTEGQYFWQQ